MEAELPKEAAPAAGEARPADEARYGLAGGGLPPDPDRLYGAVVGAALGRAAGEADELAPVLAALAAHFAGAPGVLRLLRAALGEGGGPAKAAARGLVAAFTPAPAAWGAHVAGATEKDPWAGAAAALVAGLARAAAEGRPGGAAVAAATELLEGEERAAWVGALTGAAPPRPPALKAAAAALRAFRAGREGAGFREQLEAADPAHRELVGGLAGAALGLRGLPAEGLAALYGEGGSDPWLVPAERFYEASRPVWKALE